MIKTYPVLLTIALLATHQADAAYQEEWKLFGVPGGINFFLFFNLIAMSLLLYGFMKISGTNGRLWNYVIAATGFITVVIHSAFIFSGSPEFTEPGSLLILGLLLISSTFQIFSRK